MSAHMSSNQYDPADFSACLVKQFGPLMTTADVADMFRISCESLCNTLRLSSDPRVQLLRENRVRLGRRVRFPTEAVAIAILGSVHESGEGEVGDE